MSRMYTGVFFPSSVVPLPFSFTKISENHFLPATVVWELRRNTLGYKKKGGGNGKKRINLLRKDRKMMQR